MLTYVKTSVFDSPAQTLVNAVNTVGVMGKGIAAEFKRRYPDMYAQYRAHCQSRALQPGRLYLYKSANHWVLNFPTKTDWRQPSRLEWIEIGLQKFMATYTDKGVVSVSFPMLGCGNGGLKWNDVRPLMEKYLSSLPIPVFIHVSSPSGEFQPEHEAPSGVAAINAARESVTLLEFLNGLRNGAGQGSIEELPLEDVGGSAFLQLPVDGGGTTSVSFSALTDLFNMLRLRGVLVRGEYPEELQPSAEYVEQLLLELPYIKSAEIVQGGPTRSFGVGVRFAPTASKSNAPLPPTQEPSS